MIEGRRVLGLITARGGSKGLPGKNIKPLLGKPLIGWTVEQALACPSLDAVVVSTDSAEIADVARDFGAQVPFLRPAELASDTATSADVVVHALDWLEGKDQPFDLIVLLEPTSPLRLPADVEKALKALLANPSAESIVGVAPVESGHPAFLYRLDDRGMMTPYAPDLPRVLRRQELEPLHYLEGSLYISYTAAFRARRSFYHERAMAYVVQRHQAHEVDTLGDFYVVEGLMKAYLEGSLGENV
jgi:CMP-N,N'-diacetyllegionaminic acid synthase